LLKYVKYEGSLTINQDKCKKCKKCLAIGCPAIVDNGDSIQVDRTLCVGCRLCTKLCTFDAFEKVGE
ncbi:MAG TPA: 4Fe-4S binding protein, partial [Clostridia bacterium]|nr:4Fe-4S binding protein [Clostridia bacterium]